MPEAPTAARPLPVVGHVPAFLRDKLGFLTRQARVHGDHVWLRIGGPALLVNDPASIRHILAVRPDAYRKSTRMVGPAGRALLGDGVLTREGAPHVEQRRLVMDRMRGRALTAFRPSIETAIDERLATWTSGDTIDVVREMTALARAAILRVCLGAAYDGDERIDAAVATRRAYIEHHFLASPVARLSPLPRRRHVHALATLHAAIDGARAAALRGEAGSYGLVGRLATARRDDGSPLPAELLRDEVVTTLVTGHETIADGLAWTWLLLAENPDVRAELERALAAAESTPGDAPPASATQVVLEAMRLYPPTWIFVREAVTDDVLPAGVAVPRTTRVYLCPWVTHRDPRHFPDPLRFDPGRFAPVARRDRPTHAYFPFGIGARRCIGEQLARLEMALVVAAVARRFRLERVDDRPVVPEPRLTLSPRGGLKMRLSRRDA